MGRNLPRPRAGGGITLDLGRPNPKQARFFASRCRYTAYGGARGGGKSWAVRVKAAAGALRYPGIRILIMRRTYPELESTMIRPLLALLQSARRSDGSPAGEELAAYAAASRRIDFFNGSTIRFGHLNSQRAITEYQGQEYDWIFMDEATHFTEWEFRTLAATLRGVRKIPKRMYLTCNPGGVGHMWVKRLFVDRAFEAGEDPGDYCFIPATVEDNTALLSGSPDYVRLLDLLPPDIRAAHRYGDWGGLAGQYFAELRPERHGFAPFRIPAQWPRYRAIDYGLDMFACLWIAVDPAGRAWVYRELEQPGLIVSQAAERMAAATLPGEPVVCTIAPPDLWSTQKDTGRTMAEIFNQHGAGLVRGSSGRVQGWLAVKEYLQSGGDGRPMLLISRACPRLMANLAALRRSDADPNDCDTRPHDITHLCDALRYFARFRVLEGMEEPGPAWGGEAEESYLNAGCAFSEQ